MLSDFFPSGGVHLSATGFAAGSECSLFWSYFLSWREAPFFNLTSLRDKTSVNFNTVVRIPFQTVILTKKLKDDIGLNNYMIDPGFFTLLCLKIDVFCKLIE